MTPCGPDQIDYWSVSLGQYAMGTPETVKETRLELKRRFTLAANGLDEANGTTERTSRANSQLELTKPAAQTAFLGDS